MLDIGIKTVCGAVNIKYSNNIVTAVICLTDGLPTAEANVMKEEIKHILAVRENKKHLFQNNKD